jgi:thioredoxin-like negative regulator of GroEL
MHGHTAEDVIGTVGASAFDGVVLAAPGPVAVEFMSYSCAHCRAVEAALQQVAHQLGPREQVFRVNVAQEPALAARYDVHGTPTLVMFLHGAEVGRAVGAPPDVAGLLHAVTQPFQ